MGLLNEDMTEQFLREQTPQYNNFWGELMQGKVPQKAAVTQQKLQQATTPQGQAQQAQASPGLFNVGAKFGAQQIQQNPQVKQQVVQSAKQMTRPKDLNYNLLERMIYSPSSITARHSERADEQAAFDEQEQAKEERLRANQQYQQLGNSVQDKKIKMGLMSNIPEVRKKATEALYRKQTAPGSIKYGAEGGGNQTAIWNANTGKYEPIGVPYKTGALVNNIIGDSDPAFRMTTPEENVAMGKSPDAKYMVDKKGVIKSPPGPTESQAKAVSFNATLDNAEKNFDFISQEFPNFNPAELGTVLKSNLVTGDNKLLSYGASVFQNDAEKMYANNMMDWIGANRAYISGAAVPEQEFKRDMITYFAQPGDSEAIRMMKKSMRMARQEAMQQNMNIPQSERQAFAKRKAGADYREIIRKKREEKIKNPSRRQSDKPPVGNMNDGEDRRNTVPASVNWSDL